jgi:hypothetical protein
VIVSPGTTGAVVVSHGVAPPLTVSKPVLTSAEVPYGQARQLSAVAAAHREEVGVGVDRATDAVDGDVAVRVGSPAAPEVSSARKVSLKDEHWKDW